MARRWPPPIPLRPPAEGLPDVRDGLTRIERIVLTTLAELQAERGPDHGVPTTLLYGRVVAKIDLGVPELQEILQRLVGRKA